MKRLAAALLAAPALIHPGWERLPSGMLVPSVRRVDQSPLLAVIPGLVPGPGLMSGGAALEITKIAEGTSNASSTTLVLTTTAPVAAGESIVVVACDAIFDASGMADSAGNSYVNRVNGSNGQLSFWDCLSPAALASGGTITVTYSVAANGKIALAYKFSKTVAVQSASTLASGASGAATVTTPGSVAVGSFAIGGATRHAASITHTQPANWVETQDATVSAAGHSQTVAHLQVTSAGAVTYNPTASNTTSGWTAAVVGYKDP